MIMEFWMKFDFRTKGRVLVYATEGEKKISPKLLIIYCFDAGKSLTFEEFE